MGRLQELPGRLLKVVMEQSREYRDTRDNPCSVVYSALFWAQSSFLCHNLSLLVESLSSTTKVTGGQGLGCLHGKGFSL